METALSIIIGLSLLGSVHPGQNCMRCDNVADISNCVQNIVQCGDNEECYLEKVTNDDLSISFHAGCRAKVVCAIIDTLATIGRKKRTLVNCAACCNDAPNQNVPCNANLCGLSIHPGPICMKCINVADISNCVQNIQCGNNEQCYLESVTNEDLSITYNAGCQSNTVCATLTPTYVGYKKRGLVNCAACCNDAPGNNGPCNAHLCGVALVNLEKTCLVCDGIHSEERSCNTTVTCPPYESCFSGIRIVRTAIRYVYGCYEERVCRALIENEKAISTIQHRQGRLVHGDVGLHICDACCKGYRCNAADCFDLKKKMPAVFG